MVVPIPPWRRLELSFEENMQKYISESYVKNEAVVAI